MPVPVIRFDPTINNLEQFNLESVSSLRESWMATDRNGIPFTFNGNIILENTRPRLFRKIRDHLCPIPILSSERLTEGRTREITIAFWDEEEDRLVTSGVCNSRYIEGISLKFTRLDNRTSKFYFTVPVEFSWQEPPIGILGARWAHLRGEPKRENIKLKLLNP